MHASFTQGDALGNTKTMLLINHREAQAGKLHAVLNKRVSANSKRDCSIGQACKPLPLLTFAKPSFKKNNLDANPLKPLGKFGIKLRRKNFCGRHHRCLKARPNGCGHRKCCNHRLARSHITLNQTVHRNWTSKVGLHLKPSPMLSGCKAKG